jgi:hypothetical protein
MVVKGKVLCVLKYSSLVIACCCDTEDVEIVLIGFIKAKGKTIVILNSLCGHARQGSSPDCSPCR